VEVRFILSLCVQTSNLNSVLIVSCRRIGYVNSASAAGLELERHGYSAPFAAAAHAQFL
jgi:hypothetical protein